MNCAICRSYVAHQVVANQSNDESFKDALSKREVRLSSAFLDGVREGRQLQEEHDIALLTRFREERDQAVQNLDRHKQLLDVAKGELDLLRDQVLALRIALQDVDPVSQRKNNGSPAISLSSCSDVTDATLDRLLLGSSVYSDDLDRYSTPPSRVADDDVVLTIPDDSSTGYHISNQITDTKALEAGTTSQDDAAISISISPVSLQSRAEPKTSATVTPSPPPQKAMIPLPTLKPTTLRQPFSVQHSTSVPTRLPTSPKQLTTLAQLGALMKAAHSGDESALMRVRALCASAHQTPRDQRTELQRFALTNWRNRPRSASDPPQPPPSDDVNVEIYVDASAWGIGFVMDGQWLAWKFSDVRQTAKLLDINWAEMLAVELGLWTTIHWAAWKGKQQVSFSILVRSDNAGVVKAIEKQHSSHPFQQEVLLRILDLVEEYDIQLTMKWIASMENPADNPSRGVPGLNATLLSYVPPVPQHLTDLLIPITDFV
jgi:hypothetical protein